MNRLRNQVLRRVMEGPNSLSRNRNFHAYTDPNIRQSARIGRVLRSLRQDLLGREWTGLEISRPDSGPKQVVIVISWSNQKRTCFVSEDEFALLLEDGRVFHLLHRERLL